jgi:hypothetical protein
MFTTVTEKNGRLCNQIFRNIAVSMIAEKNNLHVTYASPHKMNQLGIPLYVGKLKYKRTIALTDDNYFTLFDLPLHTNLNANDHFFQTQEISTKIKEYLNMNKESIIRANPFRYHTNNDIFIHVRLTDVQEHNPGIDYYKKAIEQCDYTHIYIGTDDPNHKIIQELTLPNVTILQTDEIQTIQFGSTCKYIILSHGSYSAIIGYVGFFSTVYYPAYKTMWYGDIFSMDGWNKIGV